MDRPGHLTGPHGEPSRDTAARGRLGFMTDSPGTVPADYRDLLDRPLYGHLGTIRPDDTVQVNPMWFEYDGSHVRFTHTARRQKYRNLQRNPAMALSVTDPDDPFRYLEVAGRLVDVVPDPEGAFFVHLRNRYGDPSSTPPADAAQRVVLVMSIERHTTQ